MSYAFFVRDKFKKGEDSLKEVVAQDMDFLHAHLGLSTEVGELGDIIKKAVFYRKLITDDVAGHIEEELGDILFYLQAMANILGLTLDDLKTSNRKKLEKRYPAGFTNKAAIERKDKT